MSRSERPATNMGLQQVGLTEEQWSVGHYLATAMVRPLFKEISFKGSFFNKSSSVAGRTECYYPSAVAGLQAANVSGNFS